MEDIMKLKTRWARAIVSKLISSTIKKAGYDVTIRIEDFEAANGDQADVVIAKVTATVTADRSAIEKLFKG